MQSSLPQASASGAFQSANRSWLENPGFWLDVFQHFSKYGHVENNDFFFNLPGFRIFRY